MFFSKNQAENDAAKLVPDLFSFSEKNFIWGQNKWSAT